MGLLDRIKRSVGNDADDQTYKYLCNRCETRFDSTDVDMSRVRCPDCGSGRVMSVPRA